MNRSNLRNDVFVGQTFSDKVPRFGYKVDSKTGDRVFGMIGEVDQQKNIDSELVNCDYTLLMQNLTATLDDFDFSEFIDSLPACDLKDPMSLLAARDNLEISYQQLPKELKAKYENNSRKFANSVISGEFADFAAEYEKSLEAASQASQADSGMDLQTELGQLRAELEQLRVDRGVSDGNTSLEKNAVGGEE